MKVYFGIALLLVGLMFGVSDFKNTEAETVQVKEASYTNAPLFGNVLVTIKCPGVPEGTVASIAATDGKCVSECRGTGGKATFDSSGTAKTTITPTCKGGTTDMVGCEFTAYWKEGSVVPKFKATVTPISGHAGDFRLDINCEK